MPATRTGTQRGVAAFDLTQRLRARHALDPARGFDGHFDLDYMGSAEFEYGAVPAALRAVRAAGELATTTVELAIATRDGRVGPDGTHPRTLHHATVHLVTPRDLAGDLTGDFRAWVESGCPARERTHFPEHATGTANAHQADTIAWWSLHNTCAWTLHADVAETLHAAFAPRA